MATVDKPCRTCGEMMEGVHHNVKDCPDCASVIKKKWLEQNKLRTKELKKTKRENGTLKKYYYSGSSQYD